MIVHVRGKNGQTFDGNVIEMSVGAEFLSVRAKGTNFEVNRNDIISMRVFSTDPLLSGIENTSAPKEAISVMTDPPIKKRRKNGKRKSKR